MSIGLNFNTVLSILDTLIKDRYINHPIPLFFLQSKKRTLYT